MGNAEYNELLLQRFMTNNLSSNSAIIELGCGKGNRLDFISKNINKHCLGVEIFKPYIDICRSINVSVFDGDIMKFCPMLQEGIKGEKFSIPLNYDESDEHIYLFDILKSDKIEILMLDVLEHLTENDALNVIKTLQSFVDRILVFVPCGHCPQEEYDGNKYQKHLSTWTDEKLQSLGFKTIKLENFHEGLPSGWSTDVVFGLWIKEE